VSRAAAPGPPRRRQAAALGEGAEIHQIATPSSYGGRVAHLVGGSVPRSTPRPSPRLGLTRRDRPRGQEEKARQALGRFVRSESWNGLVSGDVVRVAGHTARGRHWRFRAHVTNTSNGASWVEVALVEGPPPARRPQPAPATSMLAAPSSADGDRPRESGRVERVRSFAPDLVSPRWKRRSRQPRVLAPAPAAASAAAAAAARAAVAPGTRQQSLF
jgi:hypothetical protein